MTSDPMVVRYTMTLDDLIDGNRLVQRSFRWFITAIGVVVGLAGVAVLIASPGWLGLALVGYGALDLALLWLRPLEAALIRRRVASLVGDECEAAITEDGLAYVQGDSRVTFAWSALTALREDRRTLAVTSGGVVRMGIPKRAFESDTHLAAFRDAIAERLDRATPGS